MTYSEKHTQTMFITKFNKKLVESLKATEKVLKNITDIFESGNSKSTTTLDTKHCAIISFIKTHFKEMYPTRTEPSTGEGSSKSIIK